jgi:hypothetical protein
MAAGRKEHRPSQ